MIQYLLIYPYLVILSEPEIKENHELSKHINDKLAILVQEHNLIVKTIADVDKATRDLNPVTQIILHNDTLSKSKKLHITEYNLRFRIQHFNFYRQLANLITEQNHRNFAIKIQILEEAIEGKLHEDAKVDKSRILSYREMF